MGRMNYLAHAYMSMPIGITVEGANILTRNLMIFGQGAVRCHPFITREMLAAKNPDESAGLRDFDSLIFRHIGYGISNFVRTLSLGLTAGRIASRPVPDATGAFYQQLTRMSSALALIADISMLMFGGELKRKERLSARLGDILSQLYLASTVLRYYEDQGRPAADLPHVRWNVELALHHCQIAFNEFFANLPGKTVAWCLKRIVFPWGDAYARPLDRLDHELVQIMWTDNELRERITRHTWLGNRADDPAYIIEDAFRRVLATKPARDAIKAAQRKGMLDVRADLETTAGTAVNLGLCSSTEAQAWKEAEQARDRAIQVDEHASLHFSRD
jgi:hypothetical protein